ncbi:hypothetical protein C9374_007953 [Naegleria lovaniensis]|uniref:E2 ubiquitin-conjugating enzyme n=1 Tax=Naegleria lovaniensis TaxID=51637 RepID=A0AA88KGP7_NAELO|nr:uncharacterized protein C9374_007953 [Naegleria lovaniensis]KAG2378805.1 hypothetical protein C9374_007953 [Naegleria lovaniensis]
MAQRRIMKDLTQLQQNPLEGVRAAPLGDDVFNWNAYIDGPADSPYEGGIFKLKINFPVDYPFTSPKVHFVTPIYHPNVNTDGKICLTILDKEWNPAVNISQVLMTIQLLMKEPNPESAVLPSIGKQYENDRETFNKEARKQTQEHALNTIEE